MKRFRTGDRVQLIDELTGGVVLEVEGQILRIQTEDGFEIEVPMAEVVHLPDRGALPLDVPGFSALPKEDERPRKRRERGSRKERQNHAILNGSRRKRIAKGSGTRVQDVNQLLKRFVEAQKMMKKMQKMGPKGLKGMLGGRGGGQLPF